MEKLLILLISLLMAMRGAWADDNKLLSPSKLEMFVDDLPIMPKVQGFSVRDGALVPGNLTIGMFQKLWKFHRDLPATRVFAYGLSKESATVPGPTIEARRGVHTHITWENHLPSRHILPWDPTIPTAKPSSGGVPTVVHLHGGVHPPFSDGNSNSWFTSGFHSTGPTWSSPTSSYPNVQPPGNLWYHDHAMGLTRVNLLTGLIGAYILRDPSLESSLPLPSSPFDLNLIVFDRSFRTDGSIYMNSTGNNPSIHPEWQPEYFGDAIIVNGKAWPRLHVQRRRYRFRILNASNARFFRFSFSNALPFFHIGSDSTYLPKPVKTTGFLLAPSEIADVIVDFSDSPTDSAILLNHAKYPFPSGDPVDEINSKVMKFVIERQRSPDQSRIPRHLIRFPKPSPQSAVKTRYITMYEYTTPSDEPTHLYLNGKAYEDPATETPKSGTSEIWHVINLTDDNHPLHIHLAHLSVLEQREILELEKFKDCMTKLNDAIKCHVDNHAVGKKDKVAKHERGWKNVFKAQPGFVTTMLVRFKLLGPGNTTYPFDATAEPGYVYHCHILDHEDNAMMRPLKLQP
ncbi:Bilirubin oxidase protein [Dioscorea alata]|uniref:Bilirubin oxidase protein n=1 Tax=Dioscorea alata TaxID=55571 RepID=A0ACB7UE20_DIOAL|nr:Bilirubin oxidase protein [Dioscorea alata]